jgi:hypothetical protein
LSRQGRPHRGAEASTSASCLPALRPRRTIPRTNAGRSPRATTGVAAEPSGDTPCGAPPPGPHRGAASSRALRGAGRVEPRRTVLLRSRGRSPGSDASGAVLPAGDLCPAPAASPAPRCGLGHRRRGTRQSEDHAAESGAAGGPKSAHRSSSSPPCRVGGGRADRTMRAAPKHGRVDLPGWLPAPDLAAAGSRTGQGPKSPPERRRCGCEPAWTAVHRQRTPRPKPGSAELVRRAGKAPPGRSRDGLSWRGADQTLANETVGRARLRIRHAPLADHRPKPVSRFGTTSRSQPAAAGPKPRPQGRETTRRVQGATRLQGFAPLENSLHQVAV